MVDEAMSGLGGTDAGWMPGETSAPGGDADPSSRVRGAFAKVAAPFDHYLYVLECEDGSLYTGYATNVAARYAAHAAGKGARYTKAHPPVRIVATARFYSKERAMSAEARFKRLSRPEKDALLREAAAAGEPLEDVLRRELPGFGDDTAAEFVCRSLAEHAEPGFAAFEAKLIPNVSARSIVGVRTPELRRIARELVRRDDADAFLRALPHRLFEEMQVHAFALGHERDYDRMLASYEAFLPHVSNWATCDQLPVRPLAKHPDETLGHVEAWLATGQCYPMRFAIRVLMQLYLGERFEPRFLDMVATAHLAADNYSGSQGDAGASVRGGEENASTRASQARALEKDDTYYLNMMRAWYFAEAMARRPEQALPYLERLGEDAPLDEWTRRKAIQKAIESRKIPRATKERLRSFR